MNRTGQFSENADFDFEIRTVIGSASAGAAEVGEVLAAVAGIGRKDHAAWYQAWRGLADRVRTQADASADGGHPVSAAAAYLRASHYYAVAVNAASSLDRPDDLLEVFRLHRSAWDRFVDTTEVRAERVSIPYEGGALPGYLFRPAGERTTTPVLVAVNGSDGSLTSLWADCVVGALRRGYSALVFDGPGQQSMLFEHGSHFRPDWEHVLTPVYDFVSTLPGADAQRIALYGISQGGYWVPRALSFEHRYAAAVLDPGVTDVSASWKSQLPHSLLRLLENGEDEKFDRDMAIGMRFTPDTTSTWAFRARPFGTTGYAQTLRAVEEYNLESIAHQITTPLFITEPENEQFWPGQSQRLADLAPTVSALARFTAAEGADSHCEPLARALVEQRMFDWLDQQLGR